MVILNETKIKYNRLDELLEEIFLDIRFSSQVNVIVDLKEVVKKYFRPDMLSEIENHSLLVEEISSDIINIVSHYRNYFFKRKKYSSFFFLYSFEECEEMKNKFPNYKEAYYEKYFRSEENKKKIEITRRALNAVKKVISSLPNCNFIETSKFDEFAYARYLVENSKENQLNFILSNDTLFYQLLRENTFILNLKGIKSSLISHDNAIKELLKKETSLTTASLPLILSLCGDRKYSLKSVGNVALNRACAIVENLVSNGKAIERQSIEFPVEIKELNAKNKSEKIILENLEQIMLNYSLIRNDEIYFANKMKIEEGFLKTPSLSREMLLELNAKIFTRFPLQLDMLVKGESF